MPLNISVFDVCEQPIPKATFAATAQGGKGQTIHNLPVVCIAPWPNEVSIDAKAPPLDAKAPSFFYDANVVISYDGKAWSSSGAVILIGPGDSVPGDPTNSAIDVKIYLCRVRFAPALTDDSPQQHPSDWKANGVINFRRIPESRANLLTSGCFDPSTTAPKTIPNPIIDSPDPNADIRDPNTDSLAHLGYGVWLSLEVGDPPRSGSGSGEIRQLVGVWAPFRTAEKPSVVYQITPKTDNGRYPADSAIPFTGVYPYCGFGPPATQVLMKDIIQPYVRLPLNRTLFTSKTAYQIYGACPDLYKKDSGPIIITYSPALVGGSVIVEPFDCRETMGRLIGEILCFLWSNRITCTSKAGSSGVGGLLNTSAGTTTFQPLRSVPLPYDPFPKSTQTTTLVHSAGLQQLISLVRNKTYNDLKTSKENDKKNPSGPTNLRYFLPDYYAGTTTYGDDDWNQMWIINGIVGHGENVPSTRSQVSGWYKDWRDEWKGKDAVRSYCAVYTESTMKLSVTTDLVSKTEKLPKTNGQDWIEEGIDYIEFKGNKVLFGAWLRLSDTMVNKVPDQSKPTSPPGSDVHNLIYRYGVSYCAFVSGSGNVTPGPIGTILPSP